MFVPRPDTTLSSALERIRDLEKRLAVAEHAIQQTTGQTLSQLLGEQENESTLKPTEGTWAPAAASTAGTPDPTLGTTTHEHSKEIETTASEPIDISPLVLKALAIKKGVHIGSIPEDEASTQVEKLWEGLELTEQQKDQLRTWAGL